MGRWRNSTKVFLDLTHCLLVRPLFVQVLHSPSLALASSRSVHSFEESPHTPDTMRLSTSVLLAAAAVISIIYM